MSTKTFCYELEICQKLLFQLVHYKCNKSLLSGKDFMLPYNQEHLTRRKRKKLDVIKSLAILTVYIKCITIKQIINKRVTAMPVMDYSVTRGSMVRHPWVTV